MLGNKRKHVPSEDYLVSKRCKTSSYREEIESDDDMLDDLDPYEFVEDNGEQHSRLYWSIIQDNIKLAQHFATCCNTEGIENTVLCRALEENVSLEMVEWILQQRPDLINECVGFSNKSPIMCCQNVGMCILLSNFGADVNCHPFPNDNYPKKTTALHEVTDLKICEWLLLNGASTTLTNCDNQTPLAFAISSHKPIEICEMILEASDLENGKVTLSQTLNLANDYENDICSLLFSHKITKIAIK